MWVSCISAQLKQNPENCITIRCLIPVIWGQQTWKWNRVLFQFDKWEKMWVLLFQTMGYHSTAIFYNHALQLSFFLGRNSNSVDDGQFFKSHYESKFQIKCRAIFGICNHLFKHILKSMNKKIKKRATEYTTACQTLRDESD